MLQHADASADSLWAELKPLLRDIQGRVGAAGNPAIARAWRRTVERPLRLFLERPGKALRGNLVRVGWQLVRCDDPPVGLTAPIELVHAGSLILDDIQDRSRFRRGSPTLHRRVGLPIALNAGTLLCFLPFEFVKRLNLPPAVAGRLMQAMTDVVTRCHFGQALDLASPVDLLPQSEVRAFVEAAVALKTANLMGLAAGFGVTAAGASCERIACMQSVGRRIGVGLQIINDLADLSAGEPGGKRGEDVSAGKPTWPWAVLADLSSQAEYRRMCQRAKQVREGTDPPDDVAEILLERTQAECKAAAREQFRTASLELKIGFGDQKAGRRLIAELEELELNYGQ